MSWGPEDSVHVSILEWIAAVRPDAIVWHIPNGGHRTRGVALKMKRLGVRPGVADLEVVIPGHPTIYLEVKAAKGVVSPEQRQFGADMISAGRAWAIVRGIDDVRATFAENGIEVREVENSRLPLGAA